MTHRILTVFSGIQSANSQIDFVKDYLAYCQVSMVFNSSDIEQYVIVETNEKFLPLALSSFGSGAECFTNANDLINRFISLHQGSDTIVFHQFPSTLLMTCLGDKTILKKCIWFTWGGDFRRDRYVALRPFRHYLNEKWYKGNFVKRLHGIACWNRYDVDLIKYVYRSKARFYYARYSRGAKSIQGAVWKSKEALSPKRILAGNNANPSNNHLLILDILSKFQAEDIEIYMPLSYGSTDTVYREKVIAFGKEKFGAKFFPLLQYIDHPKYADFLAGLHVGVFYQHRQQGGYNMAQLLLSGAKLFLNPSSSPALHFKDVGIATFDTKDISRLQFSEFIRLEESVAQRNADIMVRERSLELNDRRWQSILFRTGSGESASLFSK
ncbi:MAG: TDP-N-acetylfucosamine:lipid II N-acetylfucosaminyltransferase [Thiocapsa sp.]|uniref:TDP-N-acetylfucosamine:lipid II N-acetylfucosaminyltransferase n=1 Tax=Thiocapsa sp. TaxID=2024551 RepID=UPI001BD07206|nr:TDP-N-acetylfucosamine:lipid II N-acetylfucosaminyltransferase [Thiocapsa sp.]QVL50128.1 MAG: TDP-N-acetylfucosamine:lipid II N-acetylfucosaminyltransferase [Thiocapsa sp.]